MQTMKMSALSVLAALAIGATSAAAQATDTTRIRVSKERIAVTKDTVTTTSTGEVTVTPTPAPAPAPVVTETVQTTTVSEVVTPPRVLLGNNLFVGLGGGALIPTGDLRNGYETGWNATGVFGWEPPASMLGLRGTISYGQVMGDDVTGASTAQNPDAQVWSVLGHLKLKLPMSWAERAGFYLIGGGGWNQIKNYNSAAFETGTPSGAYVTVNNWSIDGGAGVDIPIGIADLFIEGRMTRVFSNDDTTPAASANRNTSFAPLLIGFRVF